MKSKKFKIKAQPIREYTKQTRQTSGREALVSIALLVLCMAFAVVAGILTRVYLLVYVAAIALCIFLYGAIAYFFLVKHDAILLNDCNPYRFYRYVKIFHTMLPFLPSRKGVYKIVLAIGLRNQGKYEQAKQLLLTVDPSGFSAAEFLAYYYGNLCDVAILCGDYATARQAIDNGYAALTMLADQIQIKYRLHFQLNEKSLAMINRGETDGYEELLLKGLEQAENAYERVEYHFNLGEFYYLIQQYDEAKPHFEYVILHGNKLFHVQKAQGYMAEIEKRCDACCNEMGKE